MAPKALEAFDPNLVGGDIGGGAADLRQFVARPVLSARPWATPVPGLFPVLVQHPARWRRARNGWLASRPPGNARLAVRRSPTGRVGRLCI